MKMYKVMAYVLSSGIWDAIGHVKLRDLPGLEDGELERELEDWQSRYDAQFQRCPYEFDWDAFNAEGMLLTERIRAKLPPHSEIYYEPSDDREFFSPNDCFPQCGSPEESMGEFTLRERKRSLTHLGSFP